MSGGGDDVVHARVDDHLFGAEHAAGRVHEAERVGQRRAQRTDLEAAAPVGGEAVRGARLFAGASGASRKRAARRPRSNASATASVGVRCVARDRRGRRGRRRRPAGAPSASRRASSVGRARPAPTRTTPTSSERRRRWRAPRAARARAGARRRTGRPRLRRPTTLGGSASRRLRSSRRASRGRARCRGSTPARRPGRRPRIIASDDSSSRCSSTDGREHLHVVGHDVRAADARGERARRPLQRERAARAHAEHQVAVVARRVDEVDDVALQLGRRRGCGRARGSTPRPSRRR